MKPLLAAVLLALAIPADAGVRESGPDHFTIVHTAWVGQTPGAQWDALVDWPGWWPDVHTWSGSAANLDFDAEADGELEEEWGADNSALHGIVLNAQPGKLLRMTAPFGPLQALPVTAILDIVLAPENGGTRVTLTHRVAGPPNLKLDALAPAVDAVMAQGFARLLAHVPKPEAPETEAPETAEAEAGE